MHIGRISLPIREEKEISTCPLLPSRETKLIRMSNSESIPICSLGETPGESFDATTPDGEEIAIDRFDTGSSMIAHFFSRDENQSSGDQHP